jgi:hypothetical protein
MNCKDARQQVEKEQSLRTLLLSISFELREPAQSGLRFVRAATLGLPLSENASTKLSGFFGDKLFSSLRSLKA